MRALAWPSKDIGLDAVATDQAPYWPLRIMAWSGTVVFMSFVVGPLAGGALAAGAAIAEGWTWLACRPYAKGLPGTPARRRMAMAGVVAFTIASTTGMMAFWYGGTEPLRFMALASVFTVLVHAQLFLSRSTTAFLIVVGAQSGAILTGMLQQASYQGAEFFVTFAMLLLFGYVIIGGLINKRNAELLEAARAEAVAANQAKSAFLALMSHELRTPMNGVLGMAHALRLTKLSKRQAEHVDLLVQSGDGLMTILGDILDISKIEAGKLAFEALPTDLATLCKATVTPWMNLAQDKGVALTWTIDPATPAWVMCDPTRLRQVLANLVSNALKFTEAGSVALSVAPLPHVGEGRTRLEFVVSDSGIGMTPDQVERLFQPFVQAEASTTRRFGGTGLGLDICRRLVDMMGGIIGVESHPGSGSAFRAVVEFEIAEPVEAERGAHVGAGDVEGVRVLVVDDNAVNRTVARTILQAMGAVVETADDGAEALEALRTAAYDVVLMDIHMPGMDGVEALNRIRAGEAGPADIPVIALTADAMSGEVERLSQLGFDAVQPKPILPAELVAAIAVALAHRSAPALLAVAG